MPCFRDTYRRWKQEPLVQIGGISGNCHVQRNQLAENEAVLLWYSCTFSCWMYSQHKYVVLSSLYFISKPSSFQIQFKKWVSSFHDRFHLICTVNLRDPPVQAIHIPVNIMKVVSAATYKSYSKWQMTAGGVISLILVNCKVGMKLSRLVFRRSGGRRNVKKM